MSKSAAIMELVAGYDTYAEASELNVSAVADAPETSVPCAISAASSWKCAASVSASLGATYELSC
jgi:hypothetical protein